jgi:hypothetical protein
MATEAGYAAALKDFTRAIQARIQNRDVIAQNWA